jgi:hypothetical protein
MKPFVIIVGAILMLVIMVTGCSRPTPIAADCGGSEVVGVVTNSVGSPLSDAMIIAFKQQDTSFISADTVYSETNGNFKFTTLDSGTYRLFGQKDSLVAFKNDIQNYQFAPQGQPPVIVDVGSLILLPPGYISGRVIIDEDNMMGVVCYIPGTSYSAWTDSSGNFTISSVPPDTYRLAYQFSGYVRTISAAAVIVTSSDTAHAGTVTLLLDPAGAPLPPRGLNASYDTIHGIVTLRWQSVPVADLRDYMVFRNNNGTGLSCVATLPGDTVFVDTIFRDFADTIPKTLVYQVKAVDNLNNPSMFSDSLALIAVPPSTVRPVLLYVPLLTVVDYNSTVACSIAVVNLFDSYKVYMDFDANAATFGWTEIPHANGIAKAGFSTGNSSAWGPVAIRIVFDGDTIDTSFAVRIRPRPVTNVAADSTDSSVTIRWAQSPDSDFRQYELHRRGSSEAIIYGAAGRSDTSFTYTTRFNGHADYWVRVLDTEGNISGQWAVVSVGIINTPPRFVTMSGDLPDSAQVNIPYTYTVIAADTNSDSLSYRVLSPSGATLTGRYFSWTPAIGQIDTHQQCSVEVSDGHGGADTLSWDVRVVAHGIWTNSDSLLKSARRLFGIAELNGQVFAVGGCFDKVTGTGGPLLPAATKTVEAYDTVTHSWVPQTSLANARWAPFVAAWNNKLYVVGGFSDRTYNITAVEEYDPLTRTWAVIGQAPFVRAYGAACVLDNKLYCIGGTTYDAGQMSEVSVKSIDVFDLSAKTWSKGPDMSYARTNLQAIVNNGKILIVGGAGGTTDSIPESDVRVLNTIEVFDPATNLCTIVSKQIFTPRRNFAAAALGDMMYLIGGLDDNNSGLADVEILNVSTMQTISCVAIPQPCHGAQAMGINGRIYCIGGAVPGMNGGFVSTRGVLIYYP